MLAMCSKIERTRCKIPTILLRKAERIARPSVFYSRKTWLAGQFLEVENSILFCKMDLAL